MQLIATHTFDRACLGLCDTLFYIENYIKIVLDQQVYNVRGIPLQKAVSTVLSYTITFSPTISLKIPIPHLL